MFYFLNFCVTTTSLPSVERYLVVVEGLADFLDPESYAGGSLVLLVGKPCAPATQARQVKG